MPQKLVAPKRLKLEKIARLNLQEIRYLYFVSSTIGSQFDGDCLLFKREYSKCKKPRRKIGDGGVGSKLAQINLELSFLAYHIFKIQPTCLLETTCLSYFDSSSTQHAY